MLKVVDLFCGAGGWSTGLKEAGHKIILSLDNWPLAIESYKLNHNVQDEKGKNTEKILCQPIEELDENDEIIKKADIIIGSPPCKTFSLLNKHRGDDLHLTKEFFRIVGDKPFIMENVARVRKVIEDSDNNFPGEGVVVKMGNFDVPQVRLRYIRSNIIAVVDALKKSKTEPIIGDVEKYIEMFSEIVDETDIPKHSERIIKHMSEVGNGEIHPKNTRGVYYRTPKSGLTHAIVNVTKSMTIHPIHDRRLTVNEAAILQTFPPNYKLSGNIMERGEQIANAVPPKFAEYIGNVLSKQNVNKLMSEKIKKIDGNLDNYIDGARINKK